MSTLKNNSRMGFALAAVLIASGGTAQTWTQKADHPDCRYDGVSFSIGDDSYYGTGITCAGTMNSIFRKFDPLANTWTNIAPFPGTARRIAGAFSLNGKGYVVCGISQMGTGLSDVWAYDPVSNSWTQKNDFPGPARGSMATATCNGKAYMVGGVNNPYTYRDTWEYEPDADAWTQKADFGGSWVFQASGFSLGSDVFIVFGRDELGIALRELWKFDPAANTWTQRADYPSDGRTDAAAFAINGVGYAGFGGEGTDYFGDFHAYNASTDQWTAVVGIPGSPGYYDGWTATASAGYCFMKIENNYAPMTWEFAPSGTASVGERDATALVSATSPAPGHLAITNRAAAAGTFQVLASNGQLVRTIALSGGERMELELAPGLYVVSAIGARGAVRAAVR